MTRYSSTMTEALQEIREGFSPKQIKMAIGIAADKRYARGNYSGAVKQIEKIKKGLSDHPQVAAVLKRLNTDFDPELEEEVELDELKMDDPKLVKKFDKLKRGDTVKLKTSSTISKGTDFVDYVVKAKNTVNKGRVEKITLVTKGNEKAVKKFLYKRDGKVTFAIGDMGASIDDIKEAALAIAEKLKVSDGVGAWIKDFQKSDAPQFQGKSEEDRKKMALAAFADAGGKLEEVELTEALKPKDKKTVDAFYKGEFMNGFALISDGKKLYSTTQTIATKEGSKFKIVAKMDGRFTQSVVNYIKKTFPKNVVSEEVELDEMDMKYILINMQGKVQGYASDEKDAKDIARRTKSTMHKIKKKISDKTLEKMNALAKTPKELKDLGIIEEDEKKMDKPDSAKMVDQGREDKKKTRIAQLQLQIAKAQETINKLNAQEKPNG